MVTGALLTGCYKDEGLDAEDPAGNTQLPAATYTLNGTVIDGKTGDVIDIKTLAAGEVFTVSPSTGLSVNNNSFTALVAPGNVVITIQKAGYKPISKTVAIQAIAAGQSAVYSQLITMVPTATPPVSKVAKYDVSVEAFLEDNTLFPAANYTSKLYKAGTTTPVAMTNVEAGVYQLIVNPTDITLYNEYTSIVTLEEVAVPADFAGNLKKAFVVFITQVSQPVEMVTFTQKFTNLTGELLNVKNAIMTMNGVTIASITGFNIISHEMPKAEVGNKEIAVVYTYVDEAGVEKTGRSIFAAGQYTNTTLIDLSASSSASTEVGVADDKGTLTPGVTSIDGGTIDIKENIIATVNGVPLTTAISIQRQIAEELENESTLRVYEGKPAGTIFSEPIQISFKDMYGKELGDLALMYKGTDGKWAVDTNGGSITSGASSYTMNIKHFSEFKAEVKVVTVPKTEVETATETFNVNKKNDTDNAIVVKVKVNAEIGTAFETSIIDAVKKAGFTNTLAIQKVAAVIESYLLELNLSNTGITEYEETKDYTLPARTCFESYDRKRTYTLGTYTFTINGKVVTIKTKTADKTELVNEKTVYYGHGHGHGHGHGDDNLAGGGIIDAE